MKDKDVLLVNVYGGSNRDTPDFYEELTEMVKEYQNHDITKVGDWNLVLDPQLDSYNYKHNYKQSKSPSRPLKICSSFIYGPTINMSIILAPITGGVRCSTGPT